MGSTNERVPRRWRGLGLCLRLIGSPNERSQELAVVLPVTNPQLLHYHRAAVATKRSTRKMWKNQRMRSPRRRPPDNLKA
jgi:hypothetical protein